MFYVYFEDGACEYGDVGLKAFDTKENALEFIHHRLSVKTKRNIENYTLIEGQLIDLHNVTE